MIIAISVVWRTMRPVRIAYVCFDLSHLLLFTCSRHVLVTHIVQILRLVVMAFVLMQIIILLFDDEFFFVD